MPVLGLYCGTGFFCSCSSSTPQHGLSSLWLRGVTAPQCVGSLLPEIKPVSPALAGGCLTAGPPGKSQSLSLKQNLWPSLKLIWGSPWSKQVPSGDSFSWDPLPWLPGTAHHSDSSCVQSYVWLQEKVGDVALLSIHGTPHHLGTLALLPQPGLPRSLMKIASPASFESWEELDDL